MYNPVELEFGIPQMYPNGLKCPECHSSLDTVKVHRKDREKLPERIKAIADALARRDPVALADEAHRLKGSAATIGAKGYLTSVI